MNYKTVYDSPLGAIIITSNKSHLTGLWFCDQKHFNANLISKYSNTETKVLKDAKHWLDIYFSGKEPDFSIPVRLSGTEFQNSVWEILQTIKFGHTVSYGEIAKTLAKNRQVSRMSAQAIGGAISQNKISIIIPCHRVVGAHGELTGYVGGIERKIQLLQLEKSLII